MSSGNEDGISDEIRFGIQNLFDNNNFDEEEDEIDGNEMGTLPDFQPGWLDIAPATNNLTLTGDTNIIGNSDLLVSSSGLNFNQYNFKTITIKNKDSNETVKININNYDQIIEYIYKVKKDNIIIRTEILETCNLYEGGNLTIEKEKEIVQGILNVLNKKERRSIGDILDED